MAWTNPITWAANQILTAAQLNTHLRDNLLETAPAKVTGAGQLVYGVGPNEIAALPVGFPGQVFRTNAGATAPEWGSLFMSAALTSPATSLTLDNIPAFDVLLISVYVPGASAGWTPGLRFNADSGSNYRYSISTISSAGGSFGASGSNFSSTNLQLAPQDPGSGTISTWNILISNSAATPKVATVHGSALSTAPTVFTYIGVGAWANTSARISRIDLIQFTSTNTFNVGTFLKVLPMA